MSDEERRSLEREARYSENLTAFLICMRDGHQPATDGYFPIKWGGSHHAKAIGCQRCHLVYWELLNSKISEVSL